MSTRNLVLLGVGHTNAHVVKQWQTDPIQDCRLTCISKFPTATYSGMLPGTIGQQFDEGAMRIDLSDLCQRSGAELILADTDGLDLDAGLLQFQDHESIPFDALSIGVGSMPAGWKEHADAKSLVPIKPMQTFLARLAERLDPRGTGYEESSSAERLVDASTTKVAIVGGGVASVEIALCLNQQLAKQNRGRDHSIEIFTSNDSTAIGMKPRSIRRIEQILNSRNIHINAGHRVTEVKDDFIITDDGARHDADIVIWATGAAAPPVLGKLGLQTDAQGFIATSPTLQSLSDSRVFAVGDSGTIVKSPSPKAGVYAVRQCPILWHNLRAFFGGGPMKTFEPQSDFLKLLNTGDGKALLQYGIITVHAQWCWRLKTWIDKSFITEFQNQTACVSRDQQVA